MELAPNDADPHLNRGTAEEALQRWSEAAADYDWILERDPSDASALYNLGNVRGSEGEWQEAQRLYRLAADARPGFAMARSSDALALYQLNDLKEAERNLRNLIRRYPLFADARAALSALLWSEGSRGEAESHWAAASGLDPSIAMPPGWPRCAAGRHGQLPISSAFLPWRCHEPHSHLVRAFGRAVAGVD